MIQNNSNLLINSISMIQLEYTPPPLGIIFLAVMDDNTKIIEMVLYPEFEIEQYIIENNPKVVSVPIDTLGRSESFKLLKTATKHGAIMVAGGTHVPLLFTMDWKSEEEHPFIGHFVIGDGEYAWEGITKNVDGRKGIIWKANRKDLPDLNYLPLPAYEKTDYRKYPARTGCVKINSAVIALLESLANITKKYIDKVLSIYFTNEITLNNRQYLHVNILQNITMENI